MSPFFHGYHCLIHLGNLAGHLKSVLETSEHYIVIVNVINLIFAKSLNKRVQKIFTDVLSAPYSKLILRAGLSYFKLLESFETKSKHTFLQIVL